jgi:hypothetical protein
MEKHHSNLQYFKKKITKKIFNQVNFKKKNKKNNFGKKK